ncbi:alpha/beta hydrolase [Haloechinothrix sp. YIM 98757]|uniref:Alpha/beta hydrolase n=1 Tax=Haloechinothrix aidingensis TaxID=2752311 RepID=A0A838AA38_9PSEU|nr:alpha/beta hydrolase [Haloechinothrix aidingensis]
MTGHARWRDPRLGRTDEVRLDAGRVRYHEAGDGPALVFVHGYLVNANIWRKLVPLLSEQYRCITPDWPLGSHVVPMPSEADLSPTGIARLIAGFLEALDLRDVTLVGNDSGGAYSQLVAARHARRLSGLVLNSCETPWCSWPPNPGGFGILKAAARHPVSHRALYQALRWERAWRWRNTYGWLAKYPIDVDAMRSYVRPVITRRDIRLDGRKAISTVSARYSRHAAEQLRQSRPLPVLCMWGAEDRVFALDDARRYATELGARLRTIDDSYTYTAEDQPGRTADVLHEWLDEKDT